MTANPELEHTLRAFRQAIGHLDMDAQVRAIEWMGRAAAGDDNDTDRGLLKAVLLGAFVITAMHGSEPEFRLTEQGHQVARDAIAQSVDRRVFWERLHGRAVADEPEGEQ